MRVSSIMTGIFFLLLSGTGCVERFYPNEDDILTGTLVINAHLTDKPGEQSIQVSRSDQLYYSTYKPEDGCIIEVENEAGNITVFSEKEAGNYIALFEEDFFNSGSSYSMRLLTSRGLVYESESTILHPSSAIDSVYYNIENQATTDPAVTLEGLRFYMDVEIAPERAAFLRWELIETYEFKNPDYKGFIYDLDRVLRPLPDSMDDRNCWITAYVNAIYTLDVRNFGRGYYSFMPLHFVSNETQRLRYRYSLLVRQYSMDEPAFRYWDRLKKNSQELSGMNSSQPSLTPSNICNSANPDEPVLGFFSISGVSEKRIFVGKVPGLTVPDKLFCFPTFEFPRLRWMLNQDLPLFLSEAKFPLDGIVYFGETPQYCLDCRLRKGSSGDPPDYWPIEPDN